MYVGVGACFLFTFSIIPCTWLPKYRYKYLNIRIILFKQQTLGKAFTEIPLIAGTTIGLVAENKPIANVKFWPNPVADTASLSFEANGQFTQIGIYSMSGQLIEHLYEEKFIEGKQLLLLHLGHLRRGVYLIVLIQNQQRQSLKFVKI